MLYSYQHHGFEAFFFFLPILILLQSTMKTENFLFSIYYNSLTIRTSKSLSKNSTFCKKDGEMRPATKVFNEKDFLKCHICSKRIKILAQKFKINISVLNYLVVSCNVFMETHRKCASNSIWDAKLLCNASCFDSS